MLSGFAALEAELAQNYALRCDGWPVGPEQPAEPAWSCPLPTVQIVERPAGPERFAVVALFPFRRTDLRFPPRRFSTRRRATAHALETLARCGGAPIVFPPGGGFELARSGAFIGLTMRLSAPRRPR